MKVTTQDIIKILSLEDELKKKLLSEWNKFSEDQRINLEEIIWDTYADLYQMRFDLNTQLAFHELSDGEGSLDTKFAQRIREKTDDEFEQLFQNGLPVANLVETRGKLQDLLKDVVTNDNTITTDATKDESSN
jgi:hypothetical protein